MTAEQLIAFHETRPFRPFVIHVTDGRSFRVDHPEFLSRSPGNRTLLYWHTGERWEAIDLGLVSSLEKVDSTRKPKPKRRQ